MDRARASRHGVGRRVNAYDELLRWASEIGDGRWAQWRDVCAHLHLDPTGAARSLSDLGHVEFDWAGDRFAVAPTAAILLPRSSGSILVTGARPVGLRERLEEMVADGPHDVYAHPLVGQVGGPSTWLCEGTLEDFPDFCTDLGIVFQVQSGRRLVAALPVATLATAAMLDRPLDRLPRDWFDARARTFVSLGTQSRPGMWRVHEPRRDAHYIYDGQGWHRVQVREYGPYLACPDEIFLRHSAGRMTLSVDREAPLPPLLARAATLQSGRIPRWERRLEYVNVDAPLAADIASRLGARLEAVA